MPELEPNQIAAGFANKVTLVTVNSAGWSIMVPADARRVFIRFVFISVGGGFAFGPEGIQNTGLSNMANTQTDVEFKLRDCPSWVVGPWYAHSTPASNLWVWECFKAG